MSTNTQTGCRFYPIQCTDKTFQTLSPANGHVYFVTDKKKLYLGKDNAMIPMCASSGIFYGHKPVEYDNSGNKPDPQVTFVFDEIEGEDMPEMDDLILNVGTPEYEDGCFYRVGKIVDDTIETTRLTLQGTGGGGGGGSTGGGSMANFSISIIGTSAKVYSSTTKEMKVSFKGYYNGTEENRISQIKFIKKGEMDPFYIHTQELPFNVEHPIDLFPYINLFGSTRTTVTIVVQDLYGNERSTNFTIQIVELALKASKDKLLYSLTPEYVYACNLAGATSGVSNKKISYTFYSETNLYEPVIPVQTRELSVSDEGEMQKELDLSALPHGVYVLKVIASAVIGASNDTIYSNELTHKIARFDSANGRPLLMVMLPDVTEQYTNIPMNYLLLTNEANKAYTMDIKLDGVTETSLTVYSNVSDTYTFYFEQQGTYTLVSNIVELAVPYTTYLNIQEYTGKLPVIDPTRDDLMLYLNPRGKSNNATDRNKWKEYNNQYTANVNGLHYGAVNGWMIDQDGTSFLKLSSGATLDIPNFKPFALDPTRPSQTNSRMGYGMTIELDFKISGVLNYEADIIKCYSEDSDKTKIPVGFRITGDKVRFYNSRLSGGEKDDTLLSLNIVEGKRIRLTFVLEPNNKGLIEFPMAYVYLDGKLSGAVIYDSQDNFVDSVNAAMLEISSANAQVEIYGIRFYSSALADRVILNNYTASLSTLTERQSEYESNNVFNANGLIDYILVAAEDYDLQIPYMKITGGWATEKDSKWQLKNQTNANVGLPTGKKDYRLIDVEVKYPKNTYFADYKDYKFTNQFSSGKTMATAYGEKPSNGGAIMYAQGTSSMEYPVKNLRLRFKKESDWYTVRPDIAPVEIICMKADYMESSGSHNTGAANLVDALYTGVGIETPGQEHFGGEGKKTIVTCIKGHPCLIFYSETGEAGSYRYIGKYNLNLDKATPEPFGFDHDDDTFGYLTEGDTYYDIKYDDDGEYIAGQVETQKTVQAGDKINSIHCFEFLDNAVEVCNFLPKQGYTYEETWYNTFKNSDNELVPGWTLGFESRYPEDKVGYHDADALYPLAKWLNELYTLRKQEETNGKNASQITYEYVFKEAIAWEEFVEFYELIDGEYQPAFPTPADFATKTFYTRSIKSSRFKMDSLERFKREYQCYLDKDFLLTYYLVTEALLMADSRVKNMMIATWGKEQREYLNLSDQKVLTDNYIFYPIFYDMDTMLGLDNTGVYRFKYYSEDTDSSIFNGDEILWTFVRDALKDELAPWYTELESALLTANGILPYFNKNQANMANEAFYNGDAMYKYVKPAREGYFDYLNNKNIAPGAAPFLYALQGDRSLMREWFLSNRMQFLRGKYNSGNYQSGDRIEFRWYYPTGAEADERLSKSKTAVPPDGTFKFTSLKTGYAGVKLGANGNVYNERFQDSETKIINLPEASSANGTEAYLLGLSNLTDLGDLSNKYMQKFIIASEDVRLKDLTLGNPHKDYYNPYWKPGDSQSQAIILKGCTYLENFNLQNCEAYNNVLDFSPCPAIKKILLTGSSTGGITLPINGMLEELRLPNTITQIRIESHTNLKADKFSIGTYDYGNATKIGEGNGYVNDYSKITSLYVVDTPIDTYSIVTTPKSSLTSYYLQNIQWEITTPNSMYVLVTKEEYDNNIASAYYYYDSAQHDYLLYSGTFYPAHNIYRLVEMLNDKNEVENIPALEFLLKKTILNGTSHAEALSGTITINIPAINGTKVKVDELYMYEKYSKLYPNVKIKYGSNMEVAGAISINFYSVDVDTLGTGSVEGLEPYFTALTANGRSTLWELIDGTTFKDPAKSATNTEVFQFSGQWHDWASNKTVYYQDGYFSEDSAGINKNTLFSKFTPTKDMHLVPKFFAEPKLYTIKFYDHDYVIGDDPIFTVQSEYEKTIAEATDNPRLYYLYRNSDDLDNEHERYTFKGWQNEADFNKHIENPELVNVETTVIRRDLNLFAHYEVEDAQLVPSDSRLFTIKLSDSKDYVDIFSKGKVNMRYISINPIYRDIIGGKITLPSKDENGNDIIAIKDFTATPLLTDLYFLNNAAYTTIADGAFAWTGSSEENNTPLRNIYLPDSIRIIGDNAFANLLTLSTINLNDNITDIGKEVFKSENASKFPLQVHINGLPAALQSIGSACFSGAGENVYIDTIPDNLMVIPSSCFYNCPNVSINHFPERSQDCSIGFGAFIGCGVSGAVTSITIESPWRFSSPDSNYGIFDRGSSKTGYYNVTDVYLHSGLYSLGDDAIRMIMFGNNPREYTLHQLT